MCVCVCAPAQCLLRSPLNLNVLADWNPDPDDHHDDDWTIRVPAPRGKSRARLPFSVDPIDRSPPCHPT